MVAGGIAMVATLTLVTWENAGRKGRLTMVLAPGVLGIAIWAWPGPSQNDRYCAQAEYIVQEAGSCLLNPEMSVRRGAIARAYGTEGKGCESWISQLDTIHVRREEAVEAARWMEAEESNVLAYWRKVKGTGFCSAILARR